MRKICQEDVIKAHLPIFADLEKVKQMRKDKDPTSGQPSIQDVCNDILSALGSGEEPLMQDDYVEPEDFLPELRDYLSDQQFFMEFLSMHTTKTDISVMVQPNALALMASVTSELPALSQEHGQGASGRVPVKNMLELFLPKVYELFDERWASFGSKLLRVFSEECLHANESGFDGLNPEKVTAGLFTTWTDIDNCFKKRSQLTLHLVSRLMCGEGRLTIEDAQPCFDVLQSSPDHLVNCELRISQEAASIFWAKVLTCDPQKLNNILVLTLREQMTPKKKVRLSAGTSMAADVDSEDLLWTPKLLFQALARSSFCVFVCFKPTCSQSLLWPACVPKTEREK